MMKTPRPPFLTGRISDVTHIAVYRGIGASYTWTLFDNSEAELVSGTAVSIEDAFEQARRHQRSERTTHCAE